MKIFFIMQLLILCMEIKYLQFYNYDNNNILSVLTRSQIFIQKKISKIYTQDFKNSQKNVLFEYICAYRYLKNVSDSEIKD